LWVRVGATHKLTEKITIDLGYSHIFTDDAPICRQAPDASACTGNPTLIEAESESSIDIISASFKYNWGGAEKELEPLK
jgi:long-chain fatty acid transport protein